MQISKSDTFCCKRHSLQDIRHDSRKPDTPLGYRGLALPSSHILAVAMPRNSGTQGASDTPPDTVLEQFRSFPTNFRTKHPQLSSDTAWVDDLKEWLHQREDLNHLLDPTISETLKLLGPVFQRLFRCLRFSVPASGLDLFNNNESERNLDWDPSLASFFDWVEATALGSGSRPSSLESNDFSPPEPWAARGSGSINLFLPPNIIPSNWSAPEFTGTNYGTNPTHSKTPVCDTATQTWVNWVDMGLKFERKYEWLKGAMGLNDRCRGNGGQRN
ncbi:hypothetical protein DFH08DRAFT_826347 [Mycena albidolilacea]|uniref:Uncharacterized protein n=1 Tax=Mycena albidolilacea TaxID=1033008 RepID=A0AAD6Z0M9_9AGAR|nr:hypothetical protein DFH08DRAFT_826347 [Mycena albidolilacea]